jgi:hypothetical protein
MLEDREGRFNKNTRIFKLNSAKKVLIKLEKSKKIKDGTDMLDHMLSGISLPHLYEMSIKKETAIGNEQCQECINYVDNNCEVGENPNHIGFCISFESDSKLYHSKQRMKNAIGNEQCEECINYVDNNCEAGENPNHNGFCISFENKYESAHESAHEAILKRFKEDSENKCPKCGTEAFQHWNMGTTHKCHICNNVWKSN